MSAAHNAAADTRLRVAAPALYSALVAVRSYYFLANPTKLTEAYVCDLVCDVLAKIGDGA